MSLIDIYYPTSGSTPSQQAAASEKDKKKSLIDTYYPSAEPTVQPVAKQSSFFDFIGTAGKKISDIVSGAVEAIKPKPPIISPEVSPEIAKLQVPFKQQESSYLKFPTFFPNPDFTVKMTVGSAQLTPQGKDAFSKFWANPIDSTLNATRDLLTYHPQALQTLADAQKIVEDTPLIGIQNNPLNRSIVKGVSEGLLGSSQQVKDTFDTRLNHSVTWQGKVFETVGEVVGGVLPYLAGGAELQALGFGKATLPVLFATLGQTSAPPETTITQRIEKMPVDVAAGWLFSKVPQFRGFNPEALKGLAKLTGVASGQTVADALIYGERDPKKIAQMVATQGAIMALFHISGSAIGLLGDEILNSKTKTGTRVFSGEEVKNIVNNSKFEGTKVGDNLVKLANEADAKNMNVKIDMEAVKKSFVSTKLDLNKPEGVNLNAGLVEKGVPLPEKATIQTVFTEQAKQYTSASDFAKSLDAKPDNQIGLVKPEIITPRDPTDITTVNQYVEQFKTGKIVDPVRVTVEDNGKIITTDGSNRVVAAQQAGVDIPVIVNKGTIKGLSTIEETYNQVVNLKPAETGVVTTKPPTPPPSPIVKAVTPLASKEAIDKSYSADIIVNNKIKKPVEINGKLYIATEGNGKEVTEVIPASEYKGQTTTYSTKTITDEMRTGNTFYDGMKVNYGQTEYVLGKTYKPEALASKQEVVTPVPTEKKPVQGVTEPSTKAVPAELAQSISKITNRTSPVSIKGWGKDMSTSYIIKDMPNAYTDGILLLTDRTPDEVSKWRSEIEKANGDTANMLEKSRIEEIIPKTIQGLQKLGEPVDFIKLKYGGTPDQVVFQLKDGEHLFLNSEAWKWLNKEGYEFHVKDSLSPIALVRNGKIAGATMPIKTTEQEYGKIKGNEKATVASQGLGAGNRPRQPADIVPEGEGQQAGVGTPTEKPSGQVARRVGEGGNLSVGERSGTRIEDKVPFNVADEASKDWLDNYAEVFKLERNESLKKNLETAFINKWQRKSVELNKPSTPSKQNQADINNQVELLVLEKGSDASAYSDKDKALLRQYTGAGGLEKAGAEGRGLLDEYYTPKPIVDFMWEKVRQLTIPKTVTTQKIIIKTGEDNQPEFILQTINSTGKVITQQTFSTRSEAESEMTTEKIGLVEPKIDSMVEPSVGIGVFLEGATDIKAVLGMDISKTASTIAGILHPNAIITNVPFESNFIDLRGNKKDFPSNTDLVIGNPPYGEHRGKYRGLGEEPRIIKYEEYFLKRGLDLLKDQGLLAYVIPSSFLRSDSSYAKEKIGKLGRLEAAYRLPNGVFGTTTIGTDIVIFRKGGLTDPYFMSGDRYFDTNPKNILGQVSEGTGNYGADEVKGTLEQAIRKAQSAPAEIADTLETKDIIENEKTKKDELTATVEGTKSTTPPPANRVPQTEESRKINEKAIIEPKKQDTRIRLNEANEVELSLWKSVNVTGELNSGYTAGFSPKTFVNDKIAVVIEDGEAKYYPNVVYYAGNIYEKLDNLELFRSQISEKQYEIQKSGLDKVLPQRQTISSITLTPVSDFVKGIEVPVEEGKENIMVLFRTFMHELPWEAFGSSSSWEVEGYINGSIVNTGDKLQNIEVRKRRRKVGNDLFKRFVGEILNDGQRKHIEELYNRNFNGYFRPDYRQVPLVSEVNATFNPKRKPGSHPLDVKAIQKEGAAFLITKGTGLLGYDVGVGKTLTSIIAINEVLKRGWAKRPLIVVPNGVYRNWINEISEVIPDVKINSLMNLGGGFRGDLKTLDIGEGTLSLITYDGLVKLGFRQETYDQLTQDLRDVMTGMNNTKRGAEKELAQVEQQIGRAIKGTTDQRFFEDLGFDHITIDEAHNFKNIFAGAKLDRGKGNEFRNVRGSSSARGIKAYLMAQYVLKNNNNRNVFLLTATPFTNSPLEIYSILSLMGKKRLENLGLKNVNDFMSMFAELRPTFVVKADQSVKEEDVIEKFQNLQQLQKLVTEFIDFRTGEEAGIDRPGRIKRTVTLSPMADQVAHVKKAQELFNDKKNGGAIVAITELQNITLSPYLSRYNEHSPTYKEFVENSPKIKYAMEAIAQVHKDNKEVGQILYMPRGVDKFPLIREYLIKEKGFKPSQVGEITGGMTIDAKQTIQEKFNNGTIKVLMGTEAIKEGVNLQERSTDLYHVHLPWNPTDMLQVEGRIWRQGNDWSNVRVHYPLIENSVDSFIFQKLETKEKRIRDLWSYKENEISLGDLDFEEMKLDLITNPVIRVTAERTFETKKEKTKLEQLEIEKSFIGRKINKIVKVQEEVKSDEEALQRTIADKTNGEDQIARYKQYLANSTRELTMIRRNLQAQGIDVPDLENKVNKISEEIAVQQKVVDALDEKYDAKIKEAESQAEVILSKPNNYPLLIKPIAMEDASFFVKRRGQETVRSSDYKAPGGTADIGGYADIASAQRTVENLKAVEFPELLRIARSLMGQVPTLKTFRRAVGRFYEVGRGMIKLHPDIFKDPKLAAKVFAHEIGHLADYLPEKTLARGNILGRIASLNKFLKGRFGENEINNLDIRDELKDLSQAWKPFDELANPNFTSYRYSSRELYADALSVLFNDPALFKEKAPKFYQAFFDNIDAKPEAKEEFNKTWDLLNAGDDELFKARNEAMNQSFESGEKTWVAKTLEKQKIKTNILHALRTLFDDRNFQLNRRVREATSRGEKVEDRLNPEFAFAGLNYLEGPIKNFVADNFQPAYLKAAEVGEGWNTLGKILQLERTIYERGDLANPGGFDKNTATWQLAQLEKHTDPGEWKTILEAKDLFRKGVESLVAHAEKNGYYTPKMIEQMKANPAYSTYQVVDYLDTYISPHIHKQVGTLKDIANPATSTVMKAISTFRAIEYNNAKTLGVDFQREFFKEEVKPAKTIYTGKFRIVADPSDPSLGKVTIIRNGIVEGYYLPKEVADVFNRTTSTSIMMAARISRMITGASLYRPILTTINIGFQTFNIVRDFNSLWKKTPGLSFLGALQRYQQAFPHALNRVLDKPDEIIKTMENSKMLSLTYNQTFIQDEQTDEEQVQRILQKLGLLEKTRKRNLLTPVYTGFEMLSQIGNLIESLPKIAGYIDQKGKLPEKELAQFIRTSAGSPDFRVGGTLTPVTNNIFLFSNAYKEGTKTDMRAAFNPKSRSSFWWKTILANLLPKALMMAMSLGLLGSWLKQRMDDASEYDKTNYTVIPVGVDENGKTIYMRLPTDETGRFFGGMFWKLMGFSTNKERDLKGLFQVVDFGAGQVPNLIPSWTGVGVVMTYLSGRNPYDTFRGRNIIPDEEFKAGVKYSFPILLDWLVKNQGLSIIMPSYTPKGSLTSLEKFLSAPGLSNIFGRWIKVSEYGQTEQLRIIQQKEAGKESSQRLDEKQIINDAVKEYQKGSPSLLGRMQAEREVVKEIVAQLPANTSSTERKTKATNTAKKFRFALIRGEDDPNVNALLSATSNDQKKSLLTSIKARVDEGKFKELTNMLMKEKIVSIKMMREFDRGL